MVSGFRIEHIGFSEIEPDLLGPRWILVQQVSQIRRMNHSKRQQYAGFDQSTVTLVIQNYEFLD